MGVSLYRFSEVEAKTAKPLAVNQRIREILQANDDACWVEMERYLMPPGISGSRAFDQAYAVEILLKHDALQGKWLHKAMEEIPQLNHRALWDILVRVMRTAGFKMSHGRLTGLLESPSDENNQGQPDID